MKINLFGASGHAKVIIDIIRNCNLEINYIFDDNAEIKNILGCKVNAKYSLDEVSSSPVVISIGNNQIRQRLAHHLNCNFSKALIHPSAVVSHDAQLKEGTVVMPNSVINNSAKVGAHCIINSGAIIEHDCQIGDFVHVSPQASLGGHVEVGEGTHIGIGASVIQNINIGKNCIIGAGAVIIYDIPDGSTVVGNPGQIIKQNN
ncbi:acetyltransferase [Psychroflexus halocasei]|uniref:Acetyltransferase EpsM n=1 Tax=Psychroflexus halocasei TaxID=908615 RepID=A0A1H4DAA7_9FLAO|nr:acetyltransferase [Psychroflexus halocasei]SEA69597.1 acetyltransferase EpsM [Psychroflexus halocasei]